MGVQRRVPRCGVSCVNCCFCLQAALTAARWQVFCLPESRAWLKIARMTVLRLASMPPPSLFAGQQLGDLALGSVNVVGVIVLTPCAPILIRLPHPPFPICRPAAGCSCAGRRQRGGRHRAVHHAGRPHSKAVALQVRQHPHIFVYCSLLPASGACAPLLARSCDTNTHSQMHQHHAHAGRASAL